MAEKKTTKAAKAKAEEPVKAFMDEAAIADRVAREIYQEISDRMSMNGGVYGSLVSINIVYEACKRHMGKGR